MTKKVTNFWGKNTVHSCSENPGYACDHKWINATHVWA